VYFQCISFTHKHYNTFCIYITINNLQEIGQANPLRNKEFFVSFLRLFFYLLGMTQKFHLAISVTENYFSFCKEWLGVALIPVGSKVIEEEGLERSQPLHQPRYFFSFS